MTEPTLTNPSPTAVPWTPDMSGASPAPHTPAPAAYQPSSHPHAQAFAPNPVQANPTHPAPQPQSHTQAQAQTQAQTQAMPQPYQSEHRPQLYASTPMPVPTTAPVAAHPPQTQPSPYQGHTQTPVQQPPAPQVQRPQAVAAQHSPTQQAFHPQHQYHQQQHHQTPQQQQHAPQLYAAHPPSQPPIATQTLHAGPPPHAPESHIPAGYEEQPQSKSLLAGLLKRSPRPDEIATDMSSSSTAQGSLFNKSFILGGVTGLVIGTFLLPIVIGMFGSDTPQPQALNLTQSSAAITPPSVAEGGSFIDDAIASDTP